METDIRKKKTKAAMKEAFIDLLTDTKAEMVTVTQLTSKAQVGRVTFYLHYKDMPDFIESISGEMFTKVVLPSLADIDILNSENTRHVYTKQLYAILEDADAMNALLGPNGPSDFKNKLALIVKGEFHRRLKGHRDVINKQIDIEILIDYITHGEIEILTEWLAKGTIATPEELVEDILILTYHGIFNSLGLINSK